MPKFIHIALDKDGTVVAQFLRPGDCASFCESGKYTHLPFNLANRNHESAPLVCPVYRA